MNGDERDGATAPTDRRGDRRAEEGDSDRGASDEAIGRRGLLRAGAGAGASALAVGLGGCLTRHPRVRTDGVDASNVFEDVTVDESLVGKRAALSVSLEPGATTEIGVRRIVSISQGGSNYHAVSVESGQTSLQLYVPARQRVQVTATDNNGKTVATVSVRLTGETLP
jgi:hypothetical protein